ncbi:hypothetical protein [Solimonas sp. K1W22B-7]|uniref:hypothetical protein n=1 Tax=Solimonas sp. K1W22B-7 TaxID=2303331 RepID=UPI0013C4F8AA|nr:hypothetical protein [Solimonas sp. K1W22B-7]
MPSDRLETAPALPPLAPQARISRPLSTPEYYHACVGTSRWTLEGPRDVIFVLTCEGRLEPEHWREALQRVAELNPGTRLRLVGKRRKARWESDGLPPRMRVIENCEWDTRSGRGGEFITAEPLCLEHGPTVELLLANCSDGRSLVILRSLHAILDGGGVLHLLQELFRVLRGEALLGTNAAFSDVDLMLSTGARHSTSSHFRTTWLTGQTSGAEMGDDWRRISLGPPRKNLLARVAVAMAEFAHQRSELPALIAVPVDLRRHAPGLLSTTNFSNMLFVRLNKGDGVEQFRARLQDMLAQRMEAVYPRILDIVKWLPLKWFDLLVSRTRWNYRKRKPMETAVISNLGRCDPAAYSYPGFSLQSMFVYPLGGSAFSTLVSVNDQVEMALNLPRVLSGEGRFDAFVDHLRQRLAEGE